MTSSAEQAVLGALVLDNRALWKLGGLSADDFADAQHSRMFGAIAGAIESGAAVDTLTAEGLMEGDEDWRYLVELARETPSAANAGAYAEMVKAGSARRKAEFVLRNALDTLGNGPHVVEDAITGLGRILTRTIADATLDECLRAAEAWAEEYRRRQVDGACGGVSTTLPTVDNALGGLQGGRLYVLGARPGCYKSALAWQICLRAVQRGDPAGFLSLEMPKWELGRRAKAAGVDARGLPLRVDDHIRTLPEITARLAEWKHKHGCRLAVLDYFQLVEADGSSRHDQLSGVSRRMKAAAKDLDIPILMLAQLSRELEREKREPRLSDLRDCGQVEQDADCVMFIHVRQGVGQSSDRHELLIAKNRGGPARGRPLELVCDGKRMLVGEAT